MIADNPALSSENVYDLTPLGWYLFGFTESERKPNSCAGQNCLCICKKVSDYFGLAPNRQINECDKNGACGIIENLRDFEEVKIETPFSISIEKEGGQIVVG
jgi:hypothetical protein